MAWEALPAPAIAIVAEPLPVTNVCDEADPAPVAEFAPAFAAVGPTTVTPDPACQGLGVEFPAVVGVAQVAAT
jgi:hypothetical protein